MSDNVVSFQEKARQRYESLRQKATRGIDRQELFAYYERVLKERIEHFTALQRSIAEEILGETLIDSFTMGAEASKLRLANKRVEEIEKVYAADIEALLLDILSQSKMAALRSEEDVILLAKTAKELGRDWFRKGVFYGERQRKLRLI